MDYRFFRRRRRSHFPSSAARRSSRCAAFIASGRTTPTTPPRWAVTAASRRFFFAKPADALVPGGGEVAYPPQTVNLQHEVELVVALGRGGRDIALAEAQDCVFGYAVGFDLTRRDLQSRAKAKGQPWEMAKGFDASGPVSAIAPAATIGHPASGAIWLKVNGEQRQSGDLAQMSWKVAEVIANLSSFVRLAAGDLIFTGTPAGVSTVGRGDVLEGCIECVGELTIRLV